MTNFETLFKNFFEGKEVSDDNIKKFCEDHLGRMTSQNGGGDFTVTIAATTTAYNNYFGKMSSEDISLTIQKTLTEGYDKMIADFKKDVSLAEGFIQYTFSATPLIVGEFYPNGVSEYSSANKANIETLAIRFDAACIAHGAVLPADFLTKFSNYAKNLHTLRVSQLAKIGETDADNVGTAAARLALEVNMCGNIHFIGNKYPTQVAQCMSFFDQTIVRRGVNHDNDSLGQSTGVVTDAGGVAISDVKVTVLTQNVSKRSTKTDGSYRSPNLNVGLHKFRFEKPGLVTREIEKDIKDEGLTTLDVVMVAA